MLDRCCNNCVSATYPFYAQKHPRKRWCSKTSQFVELTALCDLWAKRTSKKTEQKPQPKQLELNFAQVNQFEQEEKFHNEMLENAREELRTREKRKGVRKG